MTQIASPAPQMPAGHADGCDCSTCDILRNTWPDAAPTSAIDLAWQTNDYARRIHWWVRLFGIIWIVIPIVATIVMLAFLLGAATNTSTNG